MLSVLQMTRDGQQWPNTPIALQVITDELGGLHRMADMVNHNVTTWCHGIWGRTVNIVAADFF
jgi:hypothetical protein